MQYGKTKRRFNPEFYEKREWLTAPGEGAPRLLCWPCLLFQPDSTASCWKSTGYRDLKNYGTAMVTHQKSKSHLEAVLQLHLFGGMEEAVVQASAANKSAHNERVGRNRAVMSRLVSVVVHLGKLGLPFRGHDESDDSKNRGNYMELLELVRKYDQTLDEHLSSSSGQFKGTSKDIQNDLIRCVHDVVVEVIDAEINEAPFFAVGADETTDNATQEQMALTVRYVDKAGNIQERFKGFQMLPGKCDAETISAKVAELCKQFPNAEDKLVSQAYDGASVMSGHENGVKAKIQEKYKYAAFLHCFAHRLNLVLMDGSRTPEVKRFFSGVRAFHTFFHRSAKRSHLLSKCGSAGRMRGGSDTRWQYQERAVHAILNNLDAIRETLRVITESDEWAADSESVTAGRGLRALLGNRHFLFLLAVYDDIFRRTGMLFQKLQSPQLDVLAAVTSVQDVLTQLQRLRSTEKFTEKVEQMESATDTSETSTTRPHRARVRKDFGDAVVYGECSYESDTSGETELRRIYFSVLDQVTESLQARFKDHEVLEIAELMDPTRYESYVKNRPKTKLQTLFKYYPDMFNQEAIINELEALWSFRDMWKEPQELLKYMIRMGLATSFPETYRLLYLILTIKPTTVTEERSFSALRRLKTFLRSTIGQDRLSHLATINIQSELVVSLERSGELAERVIEKFAQLKERRIDLLYR